MQQQEQDQRFQANLAMQISQQNNQMMQQTQQFKAQLLGQLAQTFAIGAAGHQSMDATPVYGSGPMHMHGSGGTPIQSTPESMESRQRRDVFGSGTGSGNIGQPFGSGSGGNGGQPNSGGGGAYSGSQDLEDFGYGWGARMAPSREQKVAFLFAMSTLTSAGPPTTLVGLDLQMPDCSLVICATLLVLFNPWAPNTY